MTEATPPRTNTKTILEVCLQWAEQHPDEVDEEELRELWLAWRQSQIMFMRNVETMMLRRGWISRRAVVSAASKKRR